MHPSSKSKIYTETHSWVLNRQTFFLTDIFSKLPKKRLAWFLFFQKFPFLKFIINFTKFVFNFLIKNIIKKKSLTRSPAMGTFTILLYSAVFTRHREEFFFPLKNLHLFLSSVSVAFKIGKLSMSLWFPPVELYKLLTFSCSELWLVIRHHFGKP